jgi:hypothetical protein
MTRVLVTGSRNWHAPDAVSFALDQYPPDATLVVGDCPTGADRQAREAWTGPVEVHRADWDRHGKAAGPLRNQSMVDSGADVCLAFIRAESRGATDCLERAKKANIPARVWRIR